MNEQELNLAIAKTRERIKVYKTISSNILEQLKPINDKITSAREELARLFAQCDHELEVIEGDEVSGKMKCGKCGFTIPFYAKYAPGEITGIFDGEEYDPDAKLFPRGYVQGGGCDE